MALLKRTVGVGTLRLAAMLALASISVWPMAGFAADAPAGDSGEESTRDERLEDRTRRLGDRIKSVQRKVFLKRMRHELTINAGASLNDAFYQQFTVGGAYAFHITEHFALEANFKYHLPGVRLNNVIVVRETEVAAPIQIFRPVLNLTAEAQFAPIYGKMSLMAEKIVHYDLYIAAGFGAIMTNNNLAGEAWHPMGTAAIGARVMATDFLTVRIEVRDSIYQDRRSSIVASAIQNLILFNLGVSFFLPPNFDYRYE